MKQPIEDIQNRVRNALSPINTINEIVRQLLLTQLDSAEFYKIIEYLKETNICDRVDESINKIIKYAHVADIKINDETFDIEKYIKENP